MPAKKKTASPKPKPAPRRVSSEDAAAPATATRYSAFTELGFKKTIEVLCEEIRELYLEDQVPWILGYSGGKDSTATLQLVWLALQGLPADQRAKPVHVISTDTLVENPIVAAWVQKSPSLATDRDDLLAA